MDTENIVEQTANQLSEVEKTEQTNDSNVIGQSGTQSKEIVETPMNKTEESSKETLDAIIAQYSLLNREELVAELKKLLQTNDFEQMRIRVPLLRNAFNDLPEPVREQEIAQKQTPVEENTDKSNQTSDSADNKEENVSQTTQVVEDTVKKEFYELYNAYKQRRQEHLENLEKQKEVNLKEKNNLLEELKNLLESEKTLKEIYDSFNTIQEKWKNVGSVPHSEVNHLWENYHFLIDKFYEKVKINKELRDLDLKKNLEKKLELCEKTEELLLNEDIMGSFQILQEYHKQWKQIGAVPSDKNDEIWDRFRKASDSINNRRKEYYEKRADELEANLKAKQELLDKAIEINSHVREKRSDWNQDADAMNELVEEWKKIGPVPNKYNEEIWSKFKAQKDGFFDARKEIFTQQKLSEEENYSKKIAICERAEAIAKRTDFDQATKELLQLQQDWKKIGYIKKSLNDQTWLRFRAACDEFFKLKSEDYMRTHQEAEENIQKKQQLISELESYEFTDDKVKNVETLKNFQKRWFEVGFTPKQERQKLQKKWDDIISANKEKLQITAAEITQRGSKFLESIANKLEGGTKMINNRIASIERQVELFENNLGFLSVSKNADILKKEFENKIKRLKEEKNTLLQHLKDLKKQEVQKNQTQTENLEEKSVTNSTENSNDLQNTHEENTQAQRTEN